MHRGRWLSLLFVISFVAFVAVISGCGGGNNNAGPNPPPPPPGGTATIAGTVVDSGNVAVRVANAVIRVVGSALFGQSDAQGNFNIAGITPGSVQLDVTFPFAGNYQTMRIVVQTAANQTTQVAVAAIDSSTTVPDSVTLSPGNPTIDLGGQIAFTASVRSLGISVGVAPTFYVVGNIGTILPSGVFTAATVGTGEVGAALPSASASTTVTVIGASDPEIGQLSVSPNNLPETGGPVRIAIAARDGNGIAAVIAEIELPSRITTNAFLVRETGSGKDGSWGGTYVAPPNNAPTGADGKQLEQRYSVRVKVTDNAGAVAYSGWLDFVVRGVDSPPPPP